MSKYCDDLDRSHRTSWGYGKYEVWEHDEDEPDPQLEFMYAYFPDHIKRTSDIYLRWLADNGIDPEEAEKHQTAKKEATKQNTKKKTAETSSTTPKPTPPDQPPRPPLDWLAELGLLKGLQKLLWRYELKKKKKKRVTFKDDMDASTTEEEGWD